MNYKPISYLIIIAAFVIIFIYASKRCSYSCETKDEHFSIDDKQYGKTALRDLEDLLKQGDEIPEVSDDELAKLSNDIYLVKLPTEDTTEKLELSRSENTRYWPYYYYSFPYNSKSGGAWPPGLFSRLYFWSPGFYTGTGWSYYMRPGMGYKNWPRHRWIRQTQNGNHSYYYVTNRDDYPHNAANYSDTPLQFHS
uniref:Uncharacterized protein n=1 Tax=Marseillevirus LCMAC102 TaxID=2506603 RepID=A0A481YU33_9VIRU|nr:MAG: hypothetical protein LCMAC102_04040 [Marseillevirus LCMAC102]